MRTCHLLNRGDDVCLAGPVRVAVFALCFLALLLPVVSSGHAAAGVQATYIGQVAAELDAGAFVVLDTEGFSGLLGGRRPDGSGAPAIDTWTDSGHWDPKRQQTFFMGLRQSNRFLSYHARNNAWEEIDLEREHAPPLFERFGHMYGRTALDWQRGHYYRLAGSTLHQYLIDEERWDRFENSPIGGYISMDWHYGLDMLVGLAGNELHGFREGQWFPLGQATVHGYHSSAQYNPLRKDMLFIGGNHSRQNVDILTADGTLHRMADAPFVFGISQDSLTYDPLSGNYLVLHRDRRLWEYNPDLDEWKVARDFNGPSSGWPFGRHWAVVPIPIDELGVIFWQNSRGPHLYRHEAALPSYSEVAAAGRLVQDPPSAASPGGAGLSPSPERARTREAESSSEVAQHSAPAPAASTGPEIGPVPRAADLTGSVIRALRENADRPDSAPEDAVSGGFPNEGGSALSPGDVRALRMGEKSLDDLKPAGPPPAAVALAEGGITGGGGTWGDSRGGSSIDPALIPRANPAQRPSPPRALSAVGATMRPGEWRYLTTTTPDGESGRLNFISTRFCDRDGNLGDRSTLGNGWMSSFTYDPGSESFWALLMRDRSEKKLVWLDADLRWHAVSMPWGHDCSNNRRSFNRLTLVDGKLYWPPAQWGSNRVKLGKFHVAPIAPYLEGKGDVSWAKEWGVGWGDTSSGQIGDYAFEWFPEIGGWVMRMPGPSRSVGHQVGRDSFEGPTAEGREQGLEWNARLYYFRPGVDREWVLFDRTYAQGYQGKLLYNPFKGQMLAAPGGFGPSNQWTIIHASGGFRDGPWAEKIGRPVSADGRQVGRVSNRPPNCYQGEETCDGGYRGGMDMLAYNPVNGDWLWFAYDVGKMWASADGKHWRVYDDFSDLPSARFPPERERFSGNRGLFGASAFIQMNAVPGTDLLVFFDPYRGVILHRLDPDR